MSAVLSEGGQPQATAEALLKVEDLTVELPVQSGRLARAVNGLNFSLASGEIFAIVGESGAGKSLAALSVLRLIPVRAQISGRIWFRGADLLTLSDRELRTVRGNAISMIYQDPMSALNPVWTVGEQIAETVRLHVNAGRAAAAARALEVLEAARLPNPKRVARSYPHELSGGMLQRVLIAMALSCRPQILIADEPTTALDVTVQAQILDVLLGLREEFGLSIVLITHDMGVVARTADRVLVMYAGRAVESGSAGTVLRRPRHPYTSALLRSIDLNPARGRLAAIPGAPPSLAAIPDGCPFHPRCAHAEAVCVERLPELEEADESGRLVRCYFPRGGDGD